MIFEIDNVELQFRNKPILSGIYLKSETGKVTGILGNNGCGKSSLMEIIFIVVPSCSFFVSPLQFGSYLSPLSLFSGMSS